MTPPPPPPRMTPPPPPRRTAPPPPVIIPPPPPRRTAPPPPRTVYKTTTVYNTGAGGGSSTSGADTSSTYQSKKKKVIPGWYKALCIFVTIVILAMLAFAREARREAADSVTREKLGAEACIRTDHVIGDELGWITDTKTVENGIDYFYEKTGVQPYLLICDNMDGKGGDITDEEAESYLEDLYDSMYKDEGHMIFAFMEYEESEYVTFLYTGRSANSVVDADARGIFLNNADWYYTDSSLSDEEYFASVFRTSADTIMEDKSQAVRLSQNLVRGSIVLIIIMIAGFIGFKIAEQKRIKAEEMRRILETPVGTAGNSPEEEDLIKKYLDEN